MLFDENRMDMKNTSDPPQLILASKSPRREFLLKQAGIKFSVIPSEIDESSIQISSPEQYAKQLALEKAKYIADRNPKAWVIGADTIVVIDGEVLGKPISDEDARRMLRKLSGHTHQVITGYCILCQSLSRLNNEAVTTDVTFKHLTEDEIDWYIRSGEPFDKAGAYAIQGMGAFIVKSINGSYTNVVGLPVCEVVELLSIEGILKQDGERFLEPV